MGRFQHSKKAHSEGKEKKKSKFTISKTEKIRSWKTISFTRRSIRTFGILFAISWMKDLLKKI
jgi:hypothetical protein